MANFTVAQLITQLYVGYFNRAPDPEGLAYWVERMEAGVSLEDIALSFAVQPETIAAYPFLAMENPSTGQVVSFLYNVYNNLFNRDPDAEGLAYYANQLLTGQRTAGEIISSIQQNSYTNTTAQGQIDAAVLANKVAVGEAWAAALGDREFDAAARASAEVILVGVDDTDASVDAALTQIAQELKGEFTLEAAIAAGDGLPEIYSLIDADLSGVQTLASVAAAAAIVAGAANADELELGGDFTVEDSVANILAAGELPVDVALITITDESVTYGDQQALIALGFDVVPPVHAELLLTIDVALASEALPAGYVITDADLTGTHSLAEVAAAAEIVAGAANAGDDELELGGDFSVEDTADNVIAAGADLPVDVSRISITDDSLTTEQRDALVELGFDAADLPPLNTDDALVEALANLAAAQQAKADFLDETDLDNDPLTATTEADIAANLVAANDALNLDIATNGTDIAQAEELADAAAVLATAQAAVDAVVGLNAAVAALEAAVAAKVGAAAAQVDAQLAQNMAEAAYEAANAPIVIALDGTVVGVIAEVDGELVIDDAAAGNAGVDSLLAAIKARIAAEEALADADQAVDDAQAEVNTLDVSADLAQALADLEAAQEALADYVDANPTADADLVAALNALATFNIANPDADSDLVFAQQSLNDFNITNPNLDANLETAQDEVAAFDTARVAYNSALTAYLGSSTPLTEANLIITYDALTQIDNVKFPASVVAGDIATADVTTQTQLASLEGELDDNVNVLEGLVTTRTGLEESVEIAQAVVDAREVLEDAVDAAQDVVEERSVLEGVVDDAQDDVDAALADNPRVDALAAAQADVDDIQADIDARAELKADVDAAQELVDQLAALNGDIADAEDAFGDLGYEPPINVDGAVAGTVDANDIFLFVKQSGEIDGFEINDTFFVGTGYELVVLDAGTDVIANRVGNAAVLEVFLVQDGLNSVLWFEEFAFSGNSLNQFEGWDVSLLDVDADTVQLSETGFVTTNVVEVA